MKVLKDTLEILVETWDDPGDYPSGAGAGPLPSYDYIAGVEGELVVELTEEELADYNESQKDFLDNCDEINGAVPNGITAVKWDCKLTGNRLELEVTDCDSSGYEGNGPDEPDYDGDY